MSVRSGRRRARPTRPHAPVVEGNFRGPARTVHLRLSQPAASGASERVVPRSWGGAGVRRVARGAGPAAGQGREGGRDGLHGGLPGGAVPTGGTGQRLVRRGDRGRRGDDLRPAPGAGRAGRDAAAGAGRLLRLSPAEARAMASRLYRLRTIVAVSADLPGCRLGGQLLHSETTVDTGNGVMTFVIARAQVSALSGSRITFTSSDKVA